MDDPTFTYRVQCQGKEQDIVAEDATEAIAIFQERLFPLADIGNGFDTGPNEDGKEETAGWLQDEYGDDYDVIAIRLD